MIERIDKETGEIVLYTKDEFDCKRELLQRLWFESKAALDLAKETEMTLRKNFVDFTSDPNKQEGTENIDLGDQVAKIVKSLNYNFKKTEDGKIDKKAIDRVLNTIEDLLPNGIELCESLVQWTPKLSVSEYRKLDPEVKQIFDTVITTEAAAPTLKIEDKKPSSAMDQPKVNKPIGRGRAKKKAEEA